jgi:hypothetical protein
MTTAEVTIFHDGPDLVAEFVGQLPRGLRAFGYGPAGLEAKKTCVRCPDYDLMPLRAAIDWLQDQGCEIEGMTPTFMRKLGLVA